MDFNIINVVHHLTFAFTSSQAEEMVNFFTEALNWGIEAAKGYLAYLAAVVLAVVLFNK